MAHGVCHDYDSDNGPIHQDAGLAAQGAHDPDHIRVSSHRDGRNGPQARKNTRVGAELLMGRYSHRQSIVPIGILFSFSLICGNMAYLYLSVSFIQMLKVRVHSVPSSNQAHKAILLTLPRRQMLSRPC